MNEAALFVVVRDSERVAKAHVCTNCFHMLQARTTATVEEVSQQEYNETEERHRLS